MLIINRCIFFFIPLSLLTAGIIILNPRYGNMLGGASILVSGPYFAVQEEDQITCLFNDTAVDGIFVNNQQVLCVSPALSQTGRVPFQLLVTGGTEFIGRSIFVSGKFRSVVVSCVNVIWYLGQWVKCQLWVCINFYIQEKVYCSTSL